MSGRDDVRNGVHPHSARTTTKEKTYRREQARLELELSELDCFDFVKLQDEVLVIYLHAAVRDGRERACVREQRPRTA